MSDDDGGKKVIWELIEKSQPTGHLPKVPHRDSGAGASVPTGHLPNDVAPSPAPTPSEKPAEADKKDD